ncbi:MAG: D-glycerate dehydrogenase [Phycisphaerales bacterium]|nr:D-glycerate dehydrogenase [Phycisphaerales bacterium]
MTKPIVATSRPLPAEFAVPGADIRFGPERGFPSPQDAASFFAGATAIVPWITEKVNADMLRAIGPQLKLVANFAVGVDNIDLDACRAARIRVSNTPDAVTEGTADLAFALLLAAARKLSDADRFVRSGDWANHGILGPADRIGQPVPGRTLLIVGAGRIGYATALRSLGFGMRILYWSRSQSIRFEQAPLNARRVELDDGLAQADFVSIHVPLTPDTRHLIDARRLTLMKPTAVLVSTARGPVIDEAALAAALKQRTIFAAGLDVFEAEPKVHPDLIDLDNIIMTPHFGSASTTSRAAMSALVAANVRAVLAGHEPITPVV